MSSSASWEDWCWRLNSSGESDSQLHRMCCERVQTSGNEDGTGGPPMQSRVPDESGRPVLPSTGAERRREMDLRVAELVHRSMIPANQRRENIEVVCDFRPSIGIGGDYASVHFQDEQHVVVGVCDVSGHGVASALLANRVNSFVLSQSPHVHQPVSARRGTQQFRVPHLPRHGAVSDVLFLIHHSSTSKSRPSWGPDAATLPCCTSGRTRGRSADWPLTICPSVSSRACPRPAPC